jgi:regulator of protease activity HflC (stomatin/prohibitin superfamily)
MWYFLSFVAAAALTAIKWRSFVDTKSGDIKASVALKTFVPYFAVLSVVATAFTAVVIIPAGHRGVVFSSVSGVRPVPLGEGMNFRVPFVQEVIRMNVQVTTGKYKASAASKDLQNVATEVTVNVRASEASVPMLYQQVGVDYGEKIVHPAVQECIKAVTAKYTAEELITKRELVKTQIHDILVAALKKFDIALVETYITDFDFSDAFSKAIEAKQVAAQEVMTAENKLRQVRVEAEQRIAQYKAEAEGLRLKQQSITPALIKLETVKRWNGVLPQFVTGSGGVIPMIDMKGLSSWDMGKPTPQETEGDEKPKEQVAAATKPGVEEEN